MIILDLYATLYLLLDNGLPWTTIPVVGSGATCTESGELA